MGEPMAERNPKTYKDVFLNHIRKNKMPVTVFLVNGVKLQGIVTWFDNFSVLLRRRRPFAAGLQACDLDGDAGRTDAAVRGHQRAKKPDCGVHAVQRNFLSQRRRRFIRPSPRSRRSCAVPATTVARRRRVLAEAVGLALAIDLDRRRSGEVVRLGASRRPP